MIGGTIVERVRSVPLQVPTDAERLARWRAAWKATTIEDRTKPLYSAAPFNPKQRSN